MKRLLLPGLVLVLVALPVVRVEAAGGSTGTRGVAAGDFNGDGRDDLAIGAALEDVGPEGSEIEAAGAVHVIYSKVGGLRSEGSQLWHQGVQGVIGSPGEFDNFGRALAAGDFDGDGRDDLAIGIPGKDVGPEDQAGAVQVLYGSPDGLRASGDQLWHQNITGIRDVAEEQDNFGNSLATGNFGKGGRDDLAIGIRDENTGDDGLVAAGAVAVLYGAEGGLGEQGDQYWYQDRDGVKGVGGTEEYFGFALAAANFGKGGNDDLAVGVRRDNVGGTEGAGAVNVLYGSENGLRDTNDQLWTQASDGFSPGPGEFDEFGWALTAGDFGQDSRNDLAVGSPFAEVGAADNAGVVNVFFGSHRGLRPAEAEFFSQATAGVGDSPEDFDNFGNSLTAANFGKSGRADLAVGVTLEGVPAGADNQDGIVQVFYGSSTGPAQDQIWSQATPGVLDDAEANDYFSIALAAGDFGRGAPAELVSSATGEIVGGEDNAGAANVIYGKSDGLSADDDQFWHQNSPGIAEIAEADDSFGIGELD
jgi:hypothetical protein